MASQPFRPGVAVVPATQVEISVSCRKLQDKDTFSKSDPMCVLFTKDIATDRFIEVGRTEVIKDNLNPEFVKKYVMKYLFEESQKLKFEVYDVDSTSSKLSQHDFLGRMECTLADIISSPGGRLDKRLVGPGKNCGTITVRAEEIANCKEIVHMQLNANKLDKKDFFGKSDPFLVFYRVNEDNSYTVVHKTEVIKNTLNPTWRPFKIQVRALCNGDHDRSIKVECYDWDSDGGHDLIGEFFTTMKQLTSGGTSANTYDVIHPKKKAKKKGYKNSGTVSLMSCRIEVQHSFLDYIKGGMQMNFTVAIDFTASNGNPLSPTSLHYINPYQPNQYACALRAVGEIIQDYDSDKMFPALGFGARIPPQGVVSHEFALNGDPSNPFVNGIDGIMQAYHATLQRVQLYGPTNFASVINHVSKFASAYQDGSHYFVLLIITDGVISDMLQTQQAIVQASSLPMSLIIVGVGDADFQAMEVLDGDDVRISAGGRYAERDIVQFVPFREFVGGKYGSNLQVSQTYLAKEVLAEIPDQVTEFMSKKNIKPKPPRSEIETPLEAGEPLHDSAGQFGTGSVPSSTQGYPTGQAPTTQGYPGGQTSQGYPPGQAPATRSYPPGQAPPTQGYPPPQAPTNQGYQPGQAVPPQSGYQGYPTSNSNTQTPKRPPPPNYTGVAPYPPPPRSGQASGYQQTTGASGNPPQPPPSQGYMVQQGQPYPGQQPNPSAPSWNP